MHTKSISLILALAIFAAGCAGTQTRQMRDPSQRISASVLDAAPLAVPVRSTVDNLPVMGGTPRGVQDVLAKGETAYAFWIEEANSTEITVYTSRGFFGTVDMSSLSLPAPRSELDRLALHNMEWKERGIPDTEERRKFGPLFKVRKKDYRCDFYSVENPSGRFFVIDSYRCSDLYREEKGRGELRRGLIEVRVDGEFCSIKVLDSFSTLIDAEKVREKECQ